MIERRQNPETLRLRATTPSLTADDIEASLAWYRDVLGFYVAEEMKEDGRLMGVHLKAGAVELYISQDDWGKGRGRKKGEGIRLFFTTSQSVDELAEKIRSRGGTLAQEPTDQPWGSRDLAVVDPSGFKITFASDPSGGSA